MSTTAKVKMTVEIAVSDTWGPKCGLDQIERQATESAIRDIAEAAAKTRGKIRIIGVATVMAITHTAAQDKEWENLRRLQGYAPKPAPALTFWGHIRAAFKILLPAPGGLSGGDQ